MYFSKELKKIIKHIVKKKFCRVWRFHMWDLQTHLNFFRQNNFLFFSILMKNTFSFIPRFFHKKMLIWSKFVVLTFNIFEIEWNKGLFYVNLKTRFFRGKNSQKPTIVKKCIKQKNLSDLVDTLLILFVINRLKLRC